MPFNCCWLFDDDADKDHDDDDDDDDEDEHDNVKVRSRCLVALHDDEQLQNLYVAAHHVPLRWEGELTGFFDVEAASCKRVAKSMWGTHVHAKHGL